MSGVSPLEDQLARLRHPEAPQRGRSGAVGDLGLRTQEEVTAVLASIEAGELCVDRVDNRYHNTAAAVTLPVQISVLALVGVTLLDTHVVRLVKVVR